MYTLIASENTNIKYNDARTLAEARKIAKAASSSTEARVEIYKGEITNKYSVEAEDACVEVWEEQGGKMKATWKVGKPQNKPCIIIR